MRLRTKIGGCAQGEGAPAQFYVDVLDMKSTVRPEQEVCALHPSSCFLSFSYGVKSLIVV